MVLSNGSKKARYSASISNGNQGGGSKKAGFPKMVGRDTATSNALNNTDVAHGHCCKLSSYQMNLFPNARFSRPIGTPYSANIRRFNIVG